MRAFTSALLVLVLLPGLCGCAAPERAAPAPVAQPERAVTFTDDLGREIAVESPQRVAALIGSFADVWCLAGGQDTLAATANNAWESLHLDLDESVVDIGTIDKPNLELLLSAEPDFILASSGTASNLDLRETFEKSGMTAAYFDIQSFDDYLRMLEICTRITGKPELYEQNGLSVKEQVEKAVARQDGSAPRVLFLRISGTKCRVKGSEGTVLGEMLAALGCVNIADGDKALLEDLSMEAILAADPEHIFVVLQGSDTSGAQAVLEETLLKNPAWNSLRAVQSGNYHLMDHYLYHLKPNARWGEAYEKLADILYPKS